MDWLDKTINDYEEKEKNRKIMAEEEKKRLEADLENKRLQATTALTNIYTSFLEIKKKLKSKNYSCEAKLSGYNDAHTGKQYNKEAILIVRNKPITFGAELSKTNSPYISYIESHGSENLTLEVNITESMQPPTKQSVSIKKMTKEFVDEQIEKFIKTIFS